MNYELVGPMQQEIARLNFEGKLQAVAEEKGKSAQTFSFGSWEVNVAYGLPQFGPGNNPKGNPEPAGGALVAQLGDNQFLVTGFLCRVDFRPVSADTGKQRQFMRVEEGSYKDGNFHPVRIWNGDQTDWGLNFSSVSRVLRVSLGTY